MATPAVPPLPPTAAQLRPLPQPGGGPSVAGTAAVVRPGEKPTADEEEEAMVGLTFWQTPFAQNVFPFITSLVFHLSLLALGWVTARAVQLAYQTTNREQIVVPDMSNVPESDDPNAVPHPGLGGDPNRDAAQDKFPDVKPDPDGWAERRSTDMTQDVQGGGWGDQQNNDGMIGLGANARFGRGNGIGMGNGTGSGSGTGNGGGPLAPFGIPGGGGGLGPRGTFMGLKTNVKEIVFVMDASGSMMQKFDSLRVELRKAITSLRPPQSFNVIFFQENGVGEVEKQLLFSTPDNKRKAFDFLDRTVPRGETHPEAALEAAFAQHPQLIFLLTDGDFPDNGSVLATIRRLDASKAVRVSTIAFMDRGEAYEKLLKQIADETGGNFRYVSEDDLNNP